MLSFAEARMKAAIAVLIALPAATGYAQWTSWSERVPQDDELRPMERSDRGVTVCRLVYARDREEPDGNGWPTDYPKAERNFLTRLSELTDTRVEFSDDEGPVHWVVRADSPELFRCPFLLASDVGTIALSQPEVSGLREWLDKGGFLWVDDFWGERSWEQWTEALHWVLPTSVVHELDPAHPLFRMQYHIMKIPQISHIDFWLATGRTAERSEESPEARLRVVTNATGHIQVLMTHDTDIADAFEREAEHQDYFERFSPDGYALGVNVMLYAMTH